jgi:hypothetical protein
MSNRHEKPILKKKKLLSITYVLGHELFFLNFNKINQITIRESLNPNRDLNRDLLTD